VLGAGRRAFADFAVGALALLGLVGVALVQVAHRSVYYYEWEQDVFIPLEGVLHVYAGQWPHRDFVTPVGSLWYAINALPGLVMPISARALVWANLIVALVAGMAAMVVCLGKMPRQIAGLCAFYVGLLALSPRQIGEAFSHISNNASYNRFCWAFVSVIALASLLPSPGASRRRDLVDGVVVGLLIALCFYIKVTYAAAGVGFLGLALLTTRGRSGWRFVGMAGLVAAVVVAAAGIVTGDLPGYFADMHTAVAVLPHNGRTGQALIMTAFAVPGLILVALMVLFAGAGPHRTFSPFSPGLWAALLTVGAGLAIGIQNHPEPENPLLPVALVIAWFVTRARTDGPFRYGEGLGQVAVCAALLLPVALDLGAVGWAAVAPVEVGPQTGWLAATPLADLRVGLRALSTQPLPLQMPHTEAQVAVRWDEAMILIRPHLHGRNDATVLPFTWSNPFPMLLGLPPVRHEVAWWDAERTFNEKLTPDPRLLLDHVDFVLIPHDYVFAATTEAMENAYAPQLNRDFRTIAHTPHWDLWARRDCAKRSLC